VGATVIFEGSTADAFETTLAATDPTADRTITLPNASGTVAFTSDIPTVAGVYAPLADPTFTGTPDAPTAAANTSTTQVATTAFVMTEVGDYAPLADPTFTGNVTMQSLDMDDIVAGDVIYGSGADTLARLAKGSNDQVLTLASGVPSWADAAGGGGGTSIADADADTKIQVEEGSDDDTIRFDVAGTQVATMAADVMTLEGNNNRTVQVKNTGGAYAYVTFQDTNTTAPSSGGGVTGAVRVGCQTNDLVFYADGEEKGRFLAGQGLTFNGDTAAANALDDYEEGTFTPTLIAG
ncbi:uncharacterized protein METZ01_LOCUS230301, partial [marine metagenome]